MDMPEVLETLPEELKAFIQDFLRPLVRADWRTCKALEANSIKEYHDWFNPLVYDDPWQDEVYDTDLID